MIGDIVVRLDRGNVRPIRWWERIIVPLFGKKRVTTDGKYKYEYYHWNGKVYWWKETIKK